MDDFTTTDAKSVVITFMMAVDINDNVQENIENVEREIQAYGTGCAIDKMTVTNDLDECTRIIRKKSKI